MSTRPEEMWNRPIDILVWISENTAKLESHHPIDGFKAIILDI